MAGAAYCDLAAIVAEHRRHAPRIVFINGSFDVLHRGHVAHLRQARALGDVLIVALNSDDSVARLKGPDRPVNPLPDRAGWSAPSSSSTSSPRSSRTPRVIEMVRPDVYAKGGDYS